MVETNLTYQEKIVLLKNFLGDEISEILIKTYERTELENYLNDNIDLLKKSKEQNLKEVSESFK
jgi:hypothetical protein